jgi:translocation and assembly module TamA
MTPRALATWLLVAVSQAGHAAPAAEQPASRIATVEAAPLLTAAEADAAAPTAGIRVDIVAPEPLRALVERHLDVVRLGRLARDDVEESEWSRLIDAAPAQVRELLQTEGYFSPTVALLRQPRLRAGEPDIVRLEIDAGPRARVVRLTILAEGDLERGETAGDEHATRAGRKLRQGFALQVGAEFRNPAWSEAKAAALAAVRAEGYAGAGWAGTAATVDAAKNEVALYLVVDSGPLFRYGGLTIDGLVRHEESTVRHLVAQSAGAPATEAMLLDFQERLQKSGLFEAVTVTLDTNPAQAREARLLVRLRESANQVWTFGAGFSANTRARASVEHLWRRVLDRPLVARNKAEWGERRQAWDGELSTHPGEGLWRNLLGLAIERLEGDADTVLAQRLRLGRAQEGGRIERLYFVEAERSRRSIDTGRTSNISALSVHYHGLWRDLDSVVLPTRGFVLSGQIGLGHAQGLGTQRGPFTRAYGRLTGYLPLGAAWYAQGRVEAGRVFADPGVLPPDSQLFRAGGDDSVRGYGYRSLGPLRNGVVGSGQTVFTTSVELARPVSAGLPSVWGAVFVDAGNAADNWPGLDPLVGYGVGVRWRSPVGPLKLDWAIARATGKGRLHFSIGIAF